MLTNTIGRTQKKNDRNRSTKRNLAITRKLQSLGQIMNKEILKNLTPKREAGEKRSGQIAINLLKETRERKLWRAIIV